jgi:hypothetical protein
VFARSVEVTSVSGKVTVKVPGGHPTRLRGSRTIPVGSVVDTRRGLAVVTGAPRGTTTFSADVSGAAVRVLQPRAARGGTITLELTGLDLAQCSKKSTIAKVHRAGPLKVKVPSRHRRRSSASAATVGQFQVAGRFESATSSGAATWETTDLCSATNVSAQSGTVSAQPRDFATQETELRPGYSWTLACSRSGQPPVTGLYCEGLLGMEFPSGNVLLGAGLFAKTADDRYELCITSPTRVTSCRTWAFTAPAPDGVRDGIVACAAPRAGNWKVRWRIRGVPLPPLPPYRARRASAGFLPCSGQFGSTSSPLGRTRAPLPPNAQSVNRYTLPTPAWLEDIQVYVHPIEKPGLETIQGVVYGDVNGGPGPLMGTTASAPVTSSTDADYLNLEFPQPLSLPAGDYWFGVITAGSPNIATVQLEPGTVLAFNPSAVPGVPNNPFGPFSTSDGRMSLLIDYHVDLA